MGSTGWVPPYQREAELDSLGQPPGRATARHRGGVHRAHGKASGGNWHGFRMSPACGGRGDQQGAPLEHPMALSLLRANQIWATRNFIWEGTCMTRHCMEFPNSQILDIYGGVCVCTLGRICRFFFF